MDIFSLVGRITVNYADAVRNIDQVSDAADDAADNLGDMADAADDADRPIRNTGDAASDADGKFTVWKATLSNLAATVIQNLVSKCGELAVGVLEASANAQAMNSQFTQVFGDMESQASADLSAIADSAGMMENRMKGSYTQIAAFAKTTGMDTSDALDLANRSMVAVADSAAFYDRSLEDTTESLQSFLKGNYENDAALGLSCTETTRNAAANELYGKSFNDLSEAQKQLTLLKMVEDANAASGALGQAARESDTWTNQTGNLQQAWTDFQAALGDNVLPLAVDGIKKVVEVVTDLTEKMPEIIQTFKDWSPLITGVAAALAALKVSLAISSIISAVTTAWTAYKAANEGATIAQWLLNAAMNANPIILIVTLIAGLVIAIITLWNTNEDFRNAVIAAWEAIKNAFGVVIDAIVGFFTGLWESIVSIWESIKTAFSTAIDAIVTFVTEKFTAIKDFITNIFTTVWNTITTIWETIKSVIQVAIMFIVELVTAAFELITLPWRFIWENCKEFIFAAWEAIKTGVSNALTAIQNVISTVWNAIVSFLSPILEGLKNTFTTIWNAIKTAITTVLTAIQTTITTVWNAIKTAITTVMNAIQTVFTTVWNAIKSVVTSVINAIKSVITSVFNAVKSTVTSILNSIKSTFSSVWNGIKSTVSNVINGVKSTISSGLNSAKSTVTNVLNSIKNAFSNILNGAKNVVTNAINAIKSKFNFSWSLPKLKLPHISISGSFSLTPPSVPKFGISWYKKAMDEGMIMNQPTIFGYNAKSNQFLAGGEAGSETVVGTQSLMEMIRAAVGYENEELIDRFETLISILNEYFPAILEAMARAIVLDSGALVGELAPALDDELGQIYRRKGR